jgi:UDP-glucose 4-epimerase
MARSKLAFDLWMATWPLGKVQYRLSKLPLFRRLAESWFRPEENEAIIIPVNEVLTPSPSTVLPYALLSPLLEQASHRFILNECLCRRANHCQTYPREVGCLFLGDAAAQINPALGRSVTCDEGLAHMHRAMDVGLVPLIIHSAFDAHLLGIPYQRMLAICFCCDCCCSTRQGLRLGPPAFWQTVVRLPGLVVSVGPECTGCGLCLDTCHVQAVTLIDGQARIGEGCKGCGRCASVCPAGAITLSLTDEAAALGQLRARIQHRTDIGLSAGAG